MLQLANEESGKTADGGEQTSPDPAALPCAACSSRAKGICRTIDVDTLMQIRSSMTLDDKTYMAAADTGDLTVFVIREGLASLWRETRRKGFLNDYLTASNAFATTMHGAGTYAIKAIGPLRICWLDARKLADVAVARRIHARLYRGLYEEMVRRLHERMDMVVNRRAGDRVERFRSRFSGFCDGSIPRRQLATYLGLRPETVSRLMK
jgi:CRP-like cAMP-binding protein